MSDLHEVELSIELAKQRVAKMDAVIRLANNKDYQAVIHKGYFEDFASQQVLLRADPTQQDEKEQAIINKNIDGIGALYGHLHAIVALGRQAQSAIVADQNTREEILEEEAAA